MSSGDDFTDLLERVQQLTGLDPRDAAKVAFEFDPDAGMPSPADIVAKAHDLGFDVEVKDPAPATAGPTLGPEISLDPHTVMTELYMAMPRAVPAQPHGPDEEVDVYLPKIGRAPTELQTIAPELLEELPEEIRALLLKIDLYEGKATLWLWDEANMIDRPVGPIDLKRFETPVQAIEAIVYALLPRLTRVLAADSN